MWFDTGVVIFLFVVMSLYAWRWRDLSATSRLMVPLVMFVTLGIASAGWYVIEPPGGFAQYRATERLHRECARACRPGPTQEVCKSRCLCVRTQLHGSRALAQQASEEDAVAQARAMCQR